VNAGTCSDPNTWNNVHLTCGGCKALVDIENYGEYYTCGDYCSNQDLTCTGAWEETDNTCVEESSWGCDDFIVGPYGLTKDAICQCEYSEVELQWYQVGSDIDGEAADDRSGYAVSLSANGNRIAVGAPYNDGNGEDAGHVRVYELHNEQWIQVGADIDGPALCNEFGYSVSMNATGDRVAISARTNGNNMGTVKVYEYIDNAWSQVHLDIDGEANGDRAGESVSISADGMRVAIGATTNDNNGNQNAGHVRIYEDCGTDWVQLGGDLDGEGEEDRAGVSTALSGNGARVAIGAGNNDNNSGDNAGHIRVYEYDAATKDWRQIGQTINGEEAEDRSGRVVYMNVDGSIVAVGSPKHDVDGMCNAGHVRIYKYHDDCDEWIQLGSDIDGAYTEDRFGLALAMNYAGDRIVIGGRNFDDMSNLDGEDYGHIKVYQYSEIEGDWIQIGEDMTGEAADDKFGFFVTMSADGMRVAAGARGNDENGKGAGHVKVYDLLPVSVDDRRRAFSWKFDIKFGRRELNEDYYNNDGSCKSSYVNLPGKTYKNFCGGKSSEGQCYCDDACYTYRDCCTDVADVCDYHPPQGGCVGHCGVKNIQEDCWCDDQCTTFDDCCDNYEDMCDNRRRAFSWRLDFGRRELNEDKPESNDDRRRAFISTPKDIRFGRRELSNKKDYQQRVMEERRKQ